MFSNRQIWLYHSISMSQYSTFLTQAEKHFPEMVQIRRRLHQHPELSYQEFETTRFLADHLTQLGFDVHRPLQTGCVAVLRGKQPEKRIVALRADIDALPIQEEGDHKRAFLSTKDGVGHCCGHDVHTANLLGVARMITERKEELEGTIVLVFQPGEEKIPGGGKLLCDAGILQDLGVQRIYGLHTFPYMKPGEIAVKSGPLMARPDEFRLTIHGQGGHAAAPHIAVDPIVIASQVVTTLQSIVSRAIDPNEPGVITVGKISGGTAHNVIPERVEMLGTIRSFSEETARLLSSRIEKLAQGIATAHGGRAEYHFDEGYPPVINDSQVTQTLVDIAEQLLQPGSITHLEKPVMAGEDFAFYQKYFPGTFFFLGSGSEESGSVYPWHHPKYNADETCMMNGSALLTALALHG